MNGLVLDVYGFNIDKIILLSGHTARAGYSGRKDDRRCRHLLEVFLDLEVDRLARVLLPFVPFLRIGS